MEQAEAVAGIQLEVLVVARIQLEVLAVARMLEVLAEIQLEAVARTQLDVGVSV